MASIPISIPVSEVADDLLMQGPGELSRLGVTRLSVTLAAALGLSAAVLAMLLAITGMTLSSAFAKYALMGLALLFLAGFCHYRGHDWRLKDSASIIGLGIAGLLLVGLVSVIGLRLGLPLADPLLARADALLHFDTPAAVRFTASQPLAADLLHLAYNISGALCLAAIGWRLVQGNRAALWMFITTVIVAMQITAVVSIMFPARGAILSFGLDALQAHGLPAGAGSYSAEAFAYFYSGLDPLVTLSKMNGIVTFPSFHTVLALMIVQGFWDTPARFFAVGLCALTIVSTVPMGGHYVIDLFGGFLVWLGAYSVARWALADHAPTRQLTCVSQD